MAGIFVGGVFWNRASNRRQLADTLNISQIPSSVSDINCVSYGVTDILERCAFKVAPADFNVLLGGYRYVEPAPCRPNTPVGRPCNDPESLPTTSHSYGRGPEVGRNFLIVHDYNATPKDFENGGSIDVFTDRNRSMVMVDLYIE